MPTLPGGIQYPLYRLTLIGIGIGVALFLWWLTARTRIGIQIRAGEADREMIAALGVEISWLYTIVFALGAALVVGALYTLATSPRPTQADAHLVSRHLEERTARRTVLAIAVVLGLIGFIAGLLPSEQIAEPEPTVSVPAAEVADG